MTKVNCRSSSFYFSLKKKLNTIKYAEKKSRKLETKQKDIYKKKNTSTNKFYILHRRMDTDFYQVPLAHFCGVHSWLHIDKETVAAHEQRNL